MINFISKDKTNEDKNYTEGKYECVNFAKDVNNNAESNALRCAFVKIRFNSGETHSLVAFNTTDKGLIHIEPQTDQEVNLTIGKDYWSECIIDGVYQGQGHIVEEIIAYHW